MVNWRSQLKSLVEVEADGRFPLVLYHADPPTATPWPTELAAPSESIREFYDICGGAYLGGHHRWLAVGELLEVNQHWWDLQERYPTSPEGGPIDPAHHVILAYETSGFPVVWDSRTDQLVIFFFKDRDDLDPTGPTLDELLSEIFSPDYFDETWQEALTLLRETPPTPEP